MITSIHTMIYAEDPERARAFFRDVLGLPYVDDGDGWLIFALPPAEMGVHPAHMGRTHELSLRCDDIQATVADLKAKGVEFTSDISDLGYGLFTRLVIPGGGEIDLYEPRHQSPLAV